MYRHVHVAVQVKCKLCRQGGAAKEGKIGSTKGDWDKDLRECCLSSEFMNGPGARGALGCVCKGVYAPCWPRCSTWGVGVCVCVCVEPCMHDV